jgi:probable rRNA maturation factor
MIEILNKAPQPHIPDLSKLEKITRQVLHLTNTPPESGISLHLTSDEELQQLNRQHLGINAPTDVLSFPIPFDDPETGTPYLGDILISVETAARQAENAGHPLDDELGLLVVHGVLHLLGYDHATPEEKSAMWKIQDNLLQELGISARPTES